MGRFGRRYVALGVALIATAIAFGALSSASFADDSSTNQYSDGCTATTSNCGNVLGDKAAGGKADGTERPVSTDTGGLGSQVGSLPFTGWDLVSLAAIAGALAASGLMLARLTSGRRPRA